MTTLKEACKKMLVARPNQYIHCVNEFAETFEFVMVPNGMKREDMQGTLCTDAVDKKDGTVRDTWMGDKLFKGNYKQYDRDYIENLLREPNSSRA